MDVGTHIHDVDKPDLQYHCEQPEDIRFSYRIYTDETLETIYSIPQCFSQPHHNADAAGSWDFCVDFCKKQNAVPAAIHSNDQNIFVSGHLGQTEETWLGITSIKNGMGTTWSDNTVVDYTHWIDGYPLIDDDKTQAVMAASDANFGYWKNVATAGKYRCFCQKSSVKGTAELPEYPEVPANELCDTNWIYDVDTGVCLYHDTSFRSWKSADGNCQALGGTLSSINSPNSNAQLLKIVSTYFFDPTMIGTLIAHLVQKAYIPQ